MRTRGLTPAATARQLARNAERERRERKLRELVAQHAPRLAARENEAGLDDRTLGAILKDAQADAALDSLRAIRRMLRLILLEMQRATDGDVRLPAPEVTMHRSPSPFGPRRFRQLPWLSKVIEAFLKDLETKRDAEKDLAAGRILFAAIVFGGLLNRQLVDRLPTALENGLSQHEGLCWLDIRLVASDANSTDHVRRWFPDPISQCLVIRWKQSGMSWPEGIAGRPKAILKGLFNHLAVSHGAGWRRPMSSLLMVAGTRLRLHMPGILVDFLSSDSHGQSVTPRCWWRLVGDWHLEKNQPVGNAQELADEICKATEPPERDPTPHIDDSSRDLASVFLLKKSLKVGGRFLKTKAALVAVRALRESLGPRGPMFTALLDWTDWLLQMLSSGSRRAKPQSVYRYLGSLAHALVATAGEIDPGKARPAELQAKYQEVLASIRTSEERVHAAKRLRDFHAFLVLTRDATPVEIDGVVAGKLSVRANVVSEAEYLRTLDVLDRSDLGARACKMMRAMLIVAYRVGLRRNELAYLRTSDIHDVSSDGGVSARPLLWVHAHPDVALKTDDSVRRLPLAHLLSRDELAEVRDWKQQRILECGPNLPHQALLFCTQGRHTERLPDHEIDRLVHALRHVCQDDAVVLHILRHSFLSNVFVQLFQAELEAQSVESLICPWLVGQKKQRSLLKRLFNSNALPREAAYLLSTLAGHLDPTETMQTYVHFQDWIAGQYLRSMTPPIRIALWASLEAIGPDALMVRHSREKHRTGKPVLAHRDTPLRLLRKLSLAPPAGHPANPTPPVLQTRVDVRNQLQQLPLEGVYCVLALAGRSMSQLAREHVSGIDRDVFESLTRAALEIGKIKTSTRNVAARRPRLLASRSARRRRPALSRLPQLDGFAPAIPRERTERKEAREAFRRSLLAGSSISEESLRFLLERTSHSDPVITTSTLDDLSRAVTTLEQLGIPRRRIRLEVRSLPKSASDAEQWMAEVASHVGFSFRDVALAQQVVPTTRSSKAHPAGRIAVQVIQQERDRITTATANRSDEELVSRLAHGWRVGSYYALCTMISLGAPVASGSERMAF